MLQSMVIQDWWRIWSLVATKLMPETAYVLLIFVVCISIMIPKKLTYGGPG